MIQAQEGGVKMIRELLKSAREGTSYHSIPFAMLSMGAELSLPVILLRGHEDGPVLYVGAAMHGNELNGLAVIRRVIETVQAEGLRGSAIFVPVQNPIAFQLKHAFIPREFIDSPEGNVYAAFPGSPSGQLSERIAHAIFQIVLEADCAVDLHTSGPDATFIPHAFTFFSEAGSASRARELAGIFGASLVTDQRSGPWVSGNMFLEAANRKGIPTFAVELGPGACIDSIAVTIGYRGILNVMRHLGMVEGQVVTCPDQVIITRIVPVRADRAGYLDHTVALGTWVKEGEEVSKVYDLHLREVESVKAPAAGIVHSQRTYMTINSGERTALIGVPGN
jgi:uncharacterized protein